MKRLSLAFVVAFPLLLAQPAAADVVTDWNVVALNTLRAVNAGANPGARALAIVHLSVSDAVASIDRKHETYLRRQPASKRADPEAAAAAAAASALSALFPSQASTISTALADTLSSIPDGPGKTEGIAVGNAAAAALLADRANDGSAGSLAYPGGDAPGQWRPTPPANAAAAQPFWADVTPFVLAKRDQFRPGPPPQLKSLLYTLVYNEVKRLGAADSEERSAEQTEIAHFWRPASTLQWNDIARAVALDRKLTLDQNARLFGLLNAAIADSRVAAWDAKYTYGFWRPITAITLGDTDDNPFTEADPDFQPLFDTPNHPDYPSGHSTTGAAAAEVLRRFFGDRATFTLTSDQLPGVTRSYRSFTEAQKENGRSRIYGGIHFSSADWAGQATGTKVGAYTFKHILKQRKRRHHP